jgi:hypothetical protein
MLGFSYGGLVITGALKHIAGRISHLVYLDAFVPADGDSLQTFTAAAGPAAAIGPGAGWLVPPMDRDFDDPAEAAWSAARRTPHPATRRVLQRTGTARPAAGGLPLHPDLYQGLRRAPHAATQPVLGRRGPGQDLTSLALRGTRHHPHDRQ